MYQWIIEEGELKHARKMVLRLGAKRFGAPSDDVVTTVKGIEDLERLERLIEGFTDATSWQELIQMP